ncbi:hypothetical protein CC80DRAFT_493209 [Byssothecium circinans]|uniref:Uncharacterized protein n=1 Tax=Byssothecium circinans TaxID=147558 RepID=A0A6A5TSA4_9PLEO|nr:hypothetical protein CC80DRAFT_493209 [Byssothecium circinans]
MAAPNSPFFWLSRELRDCIYHYALLNQSASTYITDVDVSLDVHYLEEENNIEPYLYNSNRNLRWLLTSRQILSEGLDQFYRHAKVQRSCTSDVNRRRDLTLDGSSSIFDIGRVKSAALYLQMGSCPVDRDDKCYNLIVPRGKERWYGNDEDFAGLGKVIKGMDHCVLESLHLTVCLFRSYPPTENANEEDYYVETDSDDSYTENYWNGYGTNLTYPNDTDGYLVDYDFLKNLGTHWKQIQIEYIPTYMICYYGDADPIPANIIAVPDIQKGLAESAKELIGNEGWIIRDAVKEVENGADRWVLKAERTSGEEKVLDLKHMGFRSYLADCDGCGKREEKFTLQDDDTGDIIKFVGGCGYVFEQETPIVGIDRSE